jgi:phenylalanyl-tRNA synthetase beta chain
MQASINWLKEYVDFNVDPDILGEQLTMAGIPVEHVEHLGKNLEQVVTGKVKEIYPHAQADKLNVCKVDVGSKILTIITGAKNVFAGAVVPVALVGAVLPNGMKIEAADLRGMMSYGMLCSAKELALDDKTLLPEEKNGIYILPPDTAVGQDIHRVLGLDDVILEFELTPNRADCFSMIGLAREIAVLTGGTLNKPILNVHEKSEIKVHSRITVKIDDAALCPRYAARLLTDVKIGPSPEWLKGRLRSAGIRSINNVVDVTNFVMLEQGQPMHAYDYSMLAKHEITVRLAEKDEKVTTLDDVRRELTEDMIVIADANGPVGVAGVMGGLCSEVTANSTTVLLEAAAFNSARIRRTARKLGLRSEASGRFERGVDVSRVTSALDRAAQLLEEMDACQVCQGIVDNYPGVVLPQQFTFTAKQVNDYLGTNFTAGDMADILRKLDFDVEGPNVIHMFKITVPSWRGDVTGMADIAEEVARLKGYDQIPATTPFGLMVQGAHSYANRICDQIKDSLCATGFCEVISYSFIHPSAFDKLQVPKADALRDTVSLINPIVEEFSDLRTTLLAGVLETVNRNLSRKNNDVKVFEVGAVYHPNSDKEVLPDEPLHLCGALTGKRAGIGWNQSKADVDFYDAKGAVEQIFASLGIADCEFVASEAIAMHPGKCAIIKSSGQTVGVVGEIHPEVLNAFNLSHKVYAFDLAIAPLVSAAQLLSNYQPLPKFPAIARDLALVVPESIAAQAVTDFIVGEGGSLLEAVWLFDVYTGEQVEAGYKSLAFSLIYRNQERTLTDIEVEPVYKKLVDAVTVTLGAKVRI